MLLLRELLRKAVEIDAAYIEARPLLCFVGGTFDRNVVVDDTLELHQQFCSVGMLTLLVQVVENRPYRIA